MKEHLNKKAYVDSPTKMLIHMQNKRLVDKKEIAMRLNANTSPHNSIEFQFENLKDAPEDKCKRKIGAMKTNVNEMAKNVASHWKKEKRIATIKIDS